MPIELEDVALFVITQGIPTFLKNGIIITQLFVLYFFHSHFKWHVTDIFN